ncbi:hypothetical protein HBI56_000120 [Parastagonospora nodorum]|uniref:RRM domain-containing protein n=1 Tax=Phaeosphaeria nodorum (strain SN15 / ATCC MYA-4574 / FGSC 10173) TaxID=321614 RepID=A0A7U2ET90_PHANO|nr:hypothetical protein HBH56_140960 [Parastagonospora nodorum]QRC91593.1 hypothetical protein JI435_010930 [Parastagonospora nodorum SN15]KAH3928165.1 hypothetical protein HBH54_146100 [Parastagonospora nodorum]KAH3948905.1 hypothetical protein HBH53_096100 [Parastagonospora nodorum]KAH3972504.1 hypothetical protein HBH52_149150 [Parastagonospora nodorum]
MSYSNNWKDGDGDFLLVISGSTRSASYLTGWQEFKDHIRKVVKEQPGWVDVYSSQSQRRGEMQGWARLRDKEDADTAYKTYSRSKGMLVHVWETCRSSEGFRILRCNCSTVFLEVPDGNHSAGRCGIDLGRVSHLTGGVKATYPPTTAPQYVSAQPIYGYGYATTQPYNIPAMYPGYAPPTQMPVYSANTYGMPVNVRHGAVLTEARGIFLQNLSYKCTSSDLYSLLLTVGQPVDYKLLRDTRTGAFKGLATATFGSQDLAERAAYCLNRVEHMGMTLSVRMDKETTAVGQAAPLIVGSDMYRY